MPLVRAERFQQTSRRAAVGSAILVVHNTGKAIHGDHSTGAAQVRVDIQLNGVTRLVIDGLFADNRAFACQGTFAADAFRLSQIVVRFLGFLAITAGQVSHAPTRIVPLAKLCADFAFLFAHSATGLSAGDEPLPLVMSERRPKPSHEDKTGRQGSSVALGGARSRGGHGGRLLAIPSGMHRGAN